MLDRGTVAGLTIVVGMLISGAANTLLNKLQDRVCVENCGTDDEQDYTQPIWQTWAMFIGELLCLFVWIFTETAWSKKVFKRGKSYVSDLSEAAAENEALISEPHQVSLKGFQYFYFAIPACCDIVGTTLLMVGLVAVSASVYQMLRGVVVIFTAAFSIVFLKKQISWERISGLVLVMAGVAVVGASPVLFPNASDNNNSMTSGIGGVLLILLAQAVAGAQFTFEESLMLRYKISPLQMVGFEGLFGTTIVTSAIIILSLVPSAGTVSPYLNVKVGWYQIAHSATLIGCVLASAVSVAFFNFFGLSITKYISATSRTTVDTCRTLLIWIISLGLGWERFIALEILGFLLLIYGTFVFNQVVPLLLCCASRFKAPEPEEDVEDYQVKGASSTGTFKAKSEENA